MTDSKMTATPVAGASSHARSTPPRQPAAASAARPVSAAKRKNPKERARAGMNRSAYDNSASRCNSGASKGFTSLPGLLREGDWRRRSPRRTERGENRRLIRIGLDQGCVEVASDAPEFLVDPDDDDL